jgi:uncharacterized protein YwqG
VDGARVLSRDELRDLATDHGLGHLADEIVSCSRLAVELRDVGEGADEGLGSQLGGAPALPEGLEWPEWRGRPLSFLAGIRLDEVAWLDEEALLPPDGMLLFFRDSVAVAAAAGGEIDEDEAGWGFDPADAGSARVFHVSADSLARRSALNGMPAHGVLPRRAVEPRGRLTMVPWESFFESPQDADVDRYIELQGALDAAQGLSESAPNHQLLGHPDQIQGDMRLECQLVTHGIYCGDASGYEDPRAAELAAGAADWRLLFQLGTDEERLGVMWGDVGKLYFWIRRQDLAARRFEATWTILQCF